MKKEMIKKIIVISGENMRKKRNKEIKILNNICFWLFIIAFLLLIAIILFFIYLYKVEAIKLIDFRSLFFSEQNEFSPALFWSSLAAIGTILSAFAAIVIGKLTLNLNKRLQDIQIRQNQLYTEPHALINNMSIRSVSFEISSTKKELKGIKDFNYPYYNDKKGDIDINNSSLVVLEFINTSEAFARLRFASAIFKNGTTIISEFDASTFGTHINHIIVDKHNPKEVAKIGLYITTNKVTSLANTELTISYFLDNNFGHCFKETQNYYISGIIDDTISFYPIDFSKNSYERI